VQENLVVAKLVETPAGEVTFHWDDGRVSTLPEGGTLRDGRCTCPAAGICRCLIRAVLAYQQRHVGGEGSAPPAESAPQAAAPPSGEGGATVPADLDLS